MKRAFFMNTNTLGQTRTVRPKSPLYPYFRISFILFVEFLSQSAKAFQIIRVNYLNKHLL